MAFDILPYRPDLASRVRCDVEGSRAILRHTQAQHNLPYSNWRRDLNCVSLSDDRPFGGGGRDADEYLRRSLAEGVATDQRIWDQRLMTNTNFRDFTAQMMDDILVLTFTAPQLQGEILPRQLGHDLETVVDASGTKKVVVDLGLLQYLPSAAFLPLLSLRCKLQSMNGRIVLCRLPPLVADVFHVVGLAGTSESRAGPLDVAFSTVGALQETDVDLAPFDVAPDLNTAVACAK